MPRLRLSARLLGALVALAIFSPAATYLASDFAYEHPPYKVHIVSKSPLVIYLVDFLTPQERAHLRDITYASFYLLC